MLERLKSAEGLKVAVLQHEMGSLQKDLDKINDSATSFMEMTTRDADPINFLLKSRNFYENLEQLIARPFKVDIDVFPYDLPRELAQKRIELEKAKSCQALIDFRDEIICRMLIERKEKENSTKTEMDQVAEEELKNWIGLSQKFMNELKKYQLICSYCAVPMDHKSINKKCKQNKNPRDRSFIGFTEKLPEIKYDGSERHFFSYPNKDHSKKLFEKREEDFGKLKEIPIKTLHQNLLFKIGQICEEKEINLLEIFNEQDVKKNNTVEKISFDYVLWNKFGLDENCINEIRTLFDPKKTGLINYLDFVRAIDDFKKAYPDHD